MESSSCSEEATAVEGGSPHAESGMPGSAGQPVMPSMGVGSMQYQGSGMAPHEPLHPEGPEGSGTVGGIDQSGAPMMGSPAMSSMQPQMMAQGMVGQPQMVSQGMVGQPQMMPQGMVGQPQMVSQGMVGQPQMMPQGMVGQPQMVSQGMVGQPQMMPQGMVGQPQMMPQGMVGQPQMVSQGMVGQPQMMPQGMVGQPQMVFQGMVGQPQMMPQGMVGQPQMVSQGMVGQPQMMPQGVQPQMIAENLEQAKGSEIGDMNRYGQYLELFTDMASGKTPELPQVAQLVQEAPGDFWKGAIVGAAAGFIFTSETVRDGIGAVIGSMFAGGSEAEEAASEE